MFASNLCAQKQLKIYFYARFFAAMRLIYITTVAFISTLLTSCGGKNEQITTGDASTNSEQQTYTDADLDRDSHTLSNYREVKVEHSHLNLEVDFDEEKLKGSVVHSIQNMSGVKEVVFDTKNLEIKNVMVDGAKASYRMGSADELLGVPLIVEIQPESKSVEIEYETTEGAEALDWVSPELTAGKGHPYLFTQGQSIFTRTWIPIMDTPGLRITYSADIKVPSHLLAVMSADNPTERNELGEYHFEMTQPVPCYLMALAVGNLEFRAIDSRTGVYSEPEMIDDCAYEFADMGKMVTQAEELYGAYQWGRYDIIVLPPSFPFGGMENPKLTFATPTIIAGDRSLVALVAHELAHSWSGNLVTNSTWNDFWLNEGFTVYFERRIMEGIYGKDYADMLAILGYQDLRRSLDELPSDEQRLKLALKRRHPDVGMTDIAYEKGCFFLKMLEEAVGRAKFDTFLNQYFEEHKFETITTEQFVDYLNDHLLDSAQKKINVAEWIYEPGIPANCPVVVSANFNNVEEQLNAFYAQNDVNSVIPDQWSTHEWLHFLRNLRENTTPEQLELIDSRFNLTETGNSEIACCWFEKSIYTGYMNGIDNKLEEFLVTVGRRKFLTPLYRALKATGRSDRALEIYGKARSNYHHVSRHTIDELLDYSES